MLSAGGLAAHRTRAHLVRCKDRLRLGHARRAMLFAHEPARPVRSAQVPGALNLFVHGTHGLVRGADRAAAARALRHLVHAHGLVGAALAMAQTRRAQAPAALGRVGPALLRMTVTHDPAATTAGFETRGTCRMLDPPGRVRADAFMHRAVRHAARRAQARVLLAGGLLVHATAGDAVIGAEILRAHGTACGASLTGAVAALVFPLLLRVHADHQLRRRAAARRAGENPRRRSGDRPLCRETGAKPSLGPDFPLDALHQDLRVAELERMYDRHHLVAAHLLRPPPLVPRFDGAYLVGIGLVREDAREVTIEPLELRGDSLLSARLPRGHPLDALFPQIAQQ